MKQSMHDLYMLHQLTYSEIDRGAGVPAGTSSNMVAWKPVPKQDAEKVLAFLAQKYQQNYTLDTVEVKLVKENTDAP